MFLIHTRQICLIRRLRSLRAIAFDFAANVFVERSEKRDDKIEHRLKIQITYLEKIGSFGVTKGFDT